ncbi:iron ABC transporter permease [Paenibacillus sp. XY044]|uniref:FecCD family ABC transporter permease n=1 Tax=Paenibacillus sp. XY044 TaxID=2026089 RepID=UPI000B998927|nr:iron ABC transporter permease [Paenibacillus sp. XY044]OZB90420.1 ferrichrome ABC transporter permease [Paenibacillus sp. XY044]
MENRKTIVFGLVLIASLSFLAFSLFFTISYGAKDLTLSTVWSAVFHYSPDLTAHQIVHEIRLPRVLGAALVGMAFGVAGAMMQGVTRNPMADTGILGVNAGATFIVVLCFAFSPNISYLSLIVFSFAGAALTTIVIVALGALAPGKSDPLQLTVAGAVIAAILHSLSTGIAIHFALSQDLAFWYAGGVAGVTWFHLRFLAPIVLIVTFFAAMMGRSISFLSLGDETATNLGLRVQLVRLLGLIVVVLLAGVSVSVAGAVSFVGLIVPHIARKLVGVDYRKIIPISAVLGAVLLVWADFAARMVNPPREFALGAMVSLVGVPFFLYLARKERREL